MAKASGGTRGGGASGRSGGSGSTGYEFGKGGSGIYINSIEQETEKALKVSANVSYNANTPKATSFWVPKSVVLGKGTETWTNTKTGAKTQQQHITVQNWFGSKLQQQMTFKGYRPTFNAGVIGKEW